MKLRTMLLYTILELPIDVNCQALLNILDERSVGVVDTATDGVHDGSRPGMQGGHHFVHTFHEKKTSMIKMLLYTIQYPSRAP